MNKTTKRKCFRCGKFPVVRTNIRENRPELCQDCLNYIYNFKPLPILTIKRGDDNNVG